MNENMEIVPLRVPREVMDEIRRISVKRSIPHAQLLRTFIKAGVETHKDMERLGLDVVYDFGFYVKEAIQEKMKGSGKKQMKLPSL